jgi:uncharacterized UPF0146 family protein
MSVIYGRSEEAWNGFNQHVVQLIDHRHCQRILEIGAGRNPALTVDFVQSRGLEYTLLDISSDEMKKAPNSLRKIQADIASDDIDGIGEYDLVFSRMLAEHVRDGAVFHRNVYRLLAANGIAFHFFPTLYAPPFLLNRLLPEKVAEILLYGVQPGRREGEGHPKFPAQYSWCRGPTKRQIDRLKSLGYNIEEYAGFFGHCGYYKRVRPVEQLHHLFVRWLLCHPVPWLTSFAYVVLSKVEPQSS